MILGIVISLLAIILLILLLKGVKTNTEISPVGWIVVIAMFILLSFENNRLVSIVDAKLNTDDYIESVKETIETCLSAVGNNHQLSQEEAQLVSIALKTSFPSMSRYIHVSDFVGKDETAIIEAIGTVARKSLNRQLLNTSGWILLTVIIGMVIIIVFSESKSTGKKSRRQPITTRRNEQYHSRRSRN